MFKQMKKTLKNQKGLTLIELLAVIVILGIIAAIAVPSIGGIIQNSRIDAVRTEAIQVLNAAKLYHSQHDEDTTITADELTEFIDNVSLNITDITVNNGVMDLTGTGEAGNVDITFTNATYELLNDDDEWEVSNNQIVVAP